MAISISVVLLLLILVVVFVRNGALKLSHCLICVLLGFFLAGSSMAPTIHNGLLATADIVSSLHP
ncbi:MULTISPECIES: hypothetical protein [Streptomyces]|uniref:Secreted protein n=2 Tax=Streptomyces avermitilis TaxID=33903 RepID=Q826N9_STRAW|nr:MULTISPECIES: hypothetical protein [Streptomyces]KUN53089.1 hypothetical protein AQJ43_19045 [Streptomyces avermitilis]MYT02682.1 hypothetical protein [Streptomyces sp. SID5469]OOV11726.1 hypothetical protein SM007_41840 [Streptomyces avermitilis]BAC74854.1 putative secreted protein [Streptomyces avermitilis MA-4680 = NBRC 14893]BBJ55460.1 hypothetical protein SAVMC3_80890 [Streptomyces avermitilis]